jgi:2-oxoglutarate ferredoxin oxidoreductase subunit alpha
MTKNLSLIERDELVVKFAGDSGDGMQLAGTFFSDASALGGNDLATFPDYPAEIRAPHNTVAGVSGFQVHIGQKKIYTSGDQCDVLIAMNPASLKSNIKWAKIGATIIVDADTFDEKSLQAAGYEENPLLDSSLSSFNLIAAPVSSFTRKIAQEMNLDVKTGDKARNMFSLGILCYITDRNINTIFHLFEKKFGKKPDLLELNKKVLHSGYSYADTTEEMHSQINVPASDMPKGKYRNITGNIATAWGLLAASERSGRPLFLGSYPITPATDILIELSKHKSLGARVFQAEDEIAGICSAIGASFAGALACTSTSGPGLSLKAEAMGLAVMTELPVVIIDVQRGGPSTGLPTKSEQSDLYQALFGRNGEAPMIVLAASSPSDCFYSAYEAAKLAMENMTPVILLTDGYIGNGSQLFPIPKVADLQEIKVPLATPNDSDFKPYKRDENLVRQWAAAGTEGLRHRIGGLEKANISGNISTDNANHQLMTDIRREKVAKIANKLPLQEVYGDKEGDVLVVSWGGTSGANLSAVQQLVSQGKKIAHAHFKYINPLPKNTEEVFKAYKQVIVTELNDGQFVNYLRMNFPHIPFKQYNKVQGLPFTVNELLEAFENLLK